MLSNVLYILPMILGRTFDMRVDRVGIDIFPQSELDKATVTDEQFTESRYETSDSSEDVRSFLRISADMALKIKSGSLDIKGTGTYLKDTSKMERTVEVLTHVKFITKTVSLEERPEPYSWWRHRNKDDLGTHYVKSITYGGELLASIRFRANKDTDFNAISAEVSNNLNSGDASNLVAEGKLEKVESRLKDKASMEISYYATVPLKNVPNTVDGLKSLVNNFGEHVKEVNDGWGVPIRVELKELSTLDPNNPQFKFSKNDALESMLTEIEFEFDDLQKANILLTEWYRSLPLSLPPDVEEKINSLYKRIQTAIRPYYDAIGRMNIEQEPDAQFAKAQEAYKEGNEWALPGRFAKDVRMLKNETIVFEKKLYGTGTGVYVRWGSTKCPKSPMMFKMSSGVMSATTNRGTGGGSSYMCLPTVVENRQVNKNFIYDQKHEFGTESSAVVAGVKYGLMDEQHPFEEHDARHYFGRGVPCSNCHMTNRTLSHMFPAQDECPEGWIFEYNGYLMGGSNLPGTHICLDIRPESYEQNTEEHQSHTLSIVHVSETQGGLPKPPYRGKMAIHCVVCSQ